MRWPRAVVGGISPHRTGVHRIRHHHRCSRIGGRLNDLHRGLPRRCCGGLGRGFFPLSSALGLGAGLLHLPAGLGLFVLALLRGFFLR